MTAVLALALALQAGIVTALRVFLGTGWLRRPVPVLIIASVVYLGASQVLLLIPALDVEDQFRRGIGPQWLADAALLETAGMLAFTVGYLVTNPWRTTEPSGDAQLLAKALDWRLLTLAAAPLAYLTYEGHGYNGLETIGAGASVTDSVASTFFAIMIVLASCGFLLRHPQWFLPVLAVQSALLAAAGERTPVIACAVTLVVLIGRTGKRPSRSQVRSAVALTLLGVLAVTGARAEFGRASGYTGFQSRIDALGSGLYASSSGSRGLLTESAVRLDGTALTAGVLQAEHYGYAKLPPTGVADSLLLTVPSALWPSKLDSGVTLNPALEQIDHFGLQKVNFLPGLPGLYAGFLTPGWLVAFLAGLGLAFGYGERCLLVDCTPARLVLLAGAVLAALDYEKGLPGILLQMRAAAAVAIVVRIVELAGERSHRSDKKLPADSASAAL